MTQTDWLLTLVSIIFLIGTFLFTRWTNKADYNLGHAAFFDDINYNVGWSKHMKRGWLDAQQEYK